MLGFQSTRPVRGATSTVLRAARQRHAFQSTRPVRGATEPVTMWSLIPQFQSTRPVRGATWTRLLAKG